MPASETESDALRLAGTVCNGSRACDSNYCDTPFESDDDDDGDDDDDSIVCLFTNDDG